MINRFHVSTPSVSLITANPQAKKAPAGDSFGLLLNAMTDPVQAQQVELQIPQQDRDTALQIATGIIVEEKLPQNAKPITGTRLMLEEIPPQIDMASPWFPALALTDLPQSEGLSTESILMIGEIPPRIEMARVWVTAAAVTVLPQSEGLRIESILMSEEKPSLGEEQENFCFHLADEKLPNAITEGDFNATELSVVESVFIANGEQPAGVSMAPVPQTPISENTDFYQIETSLDEQALADSVSTSSRPADFAQSMPFNVSQAAYAGKVVQTMTDLQTQTRSSAEAGVVELVAMPWRLQANAGMSYRSILHKFHDVSSSIKQTVKNGVNDSTVLSIHAGSAPTSTVSSGFQQTVNAQTHTANILVQVASELVDVFEMARAERSHARASIVLWPHRALHWLADGEATTAWVRDYQLDANGIQSLVDGIRCVAEQQGFTLRRIMLNGHEAWHAPSTF